MVIFYQTLEQTRIGHSLTRDGVRPKFARADKNKEYFGKWKTGRHFGVFMCRRSMGVCSLIVFLAAKRVWSWFQERQERQGVTVGSRRSGTRVHGPGLRGNVTGFEFARRVLSGFPPPRVWRLGLVDVSTTTTAEKHGRFSFSHITKALLSVLKANEA